MTNMTPADFLTAVDHAADMNDHWLFLAAFCLLHDRFLCGAAILHGMRGNMIGIKINVQFSRLAVNNQ
jgi:hypothetical protein